MMVYFFLKLIVMFLLIVVLVNNFQSLVSEIDVEIYKFIYKVIVKFVVFNFLKNIVQCWQIIVYFVYIVVDFF